jgi:hypothetical protein
VRGFESELNYKSFTSEFTKEKNSDPDPLKIITNQDQVGQKVTDLDPDRQPEGGKLSVKGVPAVPKVGAGVPDPASLGQAGLPAVPLQVYHTS